VLLVEDDLDIRDVLQDVLESEGYDVIPAANGKQALDFLTLNDPPGADLVILDLMMPMVSGWQVLERMAQDPRLNRIPVIVVSAVAREKPPRAYTFLRKPFTLDMLSGAVRDCLAPLGGAPHPAPDR
jgi:two-component system response regulator CpxR